MKKIKYKIIIVSLFFITAGDAQQLPIFTQFVSDELYFNPAIAGTKKVYDIRLTFRDQWVGFPDAPVTEGISLNYALKNNMGIAGYMYQDVTGFTKRTDYTLCYAYRIKLPNDVTLSFGLAGSMIGYQVDGSKITTNQLYDPAVDRAVDADAYAPNASTGMYLSSEKWRFGISADNLITATENFYKKYPYPADTSKLGGVQMVAHYYTYLSYINDNNENFTWQNSFFVSYVPSTPIYLAYDLRCYIKNTFYTGIDVRFGDAIALNLGYIYHESFQFAYSYDFVTSEISHFTSGSQEVTLIYSFDGKNGSGGRGDTFDKRRYKYLF